MTKTFLSTGRPRVIISIWWTENLEDMLRLYHYARDGTYSILMITDSRGERDKEPQDYLQ